MKIDIDYEPVEALNILKVAEHVPAAYAESLRAAGVPVFRIGGVRRPVLQDRADDCIRDILAMTCRELQRTGRI
jgi:hypothetical protein